MKSKLFRDTHGLDQPFDLDLCDKLSVCLRMDKSAYDFAVAESERMSVTSGEYIAMLLQREAEEQRRRLM